MFITAIATIRLFVHTNISLCPDHDQFNVLDVKEIMTEQ